MGNLKNSAIFPVAVLSIAITSAFYIAASGSGKYDATEVLLGSAWTLLLSLVIAASVIPSFLKRRS
ncbi:MAG: hypothetical protein HZB68_00540 [Candidatus Aenigmarchaeota archaeon]|nr:hypothetical protein [Candidatus Aenigmarchaeota archaeon]